MRALHLVPRAVCLCVRARACVRISVIAHCITQEKFREKLEQNKRRLEQDFERCDALEVHNSAWCPALERHNRAC